MLWYLTFELRPVRNYWKIFFVHAQTGLHNYSVKCHYILVAFVTEGATFQIFRSLLRLPGEILMNVFLGSRRSGSNEEQEKMLLEKDTTTGEEGEGRTRRNFASESTRLVPVGAISWNFVEMIQGFPILAHQARSNRWYLTGLHVAIRNFYSSQSNFCIFICMVSVRLSG